VRHRAFRGTVCVGLVAAGVFLGAASAAFPEDEFAGSGETASTASDETTTASSETATTEPTSTEPAPSPTTTAATENPGAPPTTTTTAAQSSGGQGDGPAQGGPSSSAPAPAPGPVVKPKKYVNRALETDEGPGAIIWLHRELPDPTPPAKRLSPRFALELRAAARAEGVRWTLVLAVLRARGHDGRVPAGAQRLRSLSARLSELGAATKRARALRRLGDEDFVQQVLALTRYNRAVGLRALVTGLEAAKPRLERRILRDARVDVYPGGRADIASGRVDVRVLVLIRYLRTTFGQVTVSSLHSGHRYFSRPGVVSAHMYGLAVDIAALGHVSITGHQAPGGLTERAVEAILLLPVELQPQQVISLLGLGGPSFPLADHHDHIHVGY
jgi:hypothetical protein